MRKILAISVLTVKSAVHSRVVAALLALVLLVVFVLPLTIKSDGTPAGTARILIEYTLGLVAAILALATTWAACGAISLELANRRLHLILCKPVSPAQIWIGKWLGLIAVNGVLLALAGAIVYGMLWRTLGPYRLRQNVFMTQRTVWPVPDDVAAAATQRLQILRQQRRIPAGISDARLYPRVAAELRRHAGTIQPGSSRDFAFRLPQAALPADEWLTLCYRLRSSQPERPPVACAWSCAPAEGKPAPQTMEIIPGIAGELNVLSADIPADGILTVRFFNRQFDPPVTVIVEPRAGLKLAIRSVGLKANYMQALLIIFFELAFLAALGVTAGALFSMPTAAFVAVALSALLAGGGYFAEMATATVTLPDAAGVEGTGLQSTPLAIRFVLQTISTLTLPLQEFRPIGHLAANEWLGWRQVVGAGFWYVAVYAGALALAGIVCLRRRQIGMPE